MLKSLVDQFRGNTYLLDHSQGSDGLISPRNYQQKLLPASGKVGACAEDDGAEVKINVTSLTPHYGCTGRSDVQGGSELHAVLHL